MKPLAMVLLVACALLALAGAVLLVHHGSAAAAETARPRAAGPAGTGHAGPGLPADETADATEADRSTTREPDLAGAPDARRTVAPSTGSEENRRDVLVVKALTGEPLADARVYVPVDLGDDEDAKKESQELLSSDLTAYLARFTTVSRTDGEGHGAIPADRDVSVIGLAPGLAGRAYFRKAVEGSLRLALFADTEVRVRVLDQGDQPVEGAPVSLLVRRQNGFGGSGALATEESDAAGEVRLRHLGLYMGRWSSNDLSSRFVVGLHVPSLEPIEVDLPPALDPLRMPDEAAEENAAGGEPPWITLHVPPAGSVVVHVVDEDGAPLQENGRVYLVALDEAAARRARAADQGSDRVLGGVRYWSSPLAAAEDGDARFPFVPIGLTLGVVAYAGNPSEPSALVVAGPRTAGEAQEVTIGPGKPSTRLVALLQDAEGRPLSERDVRSELRGEHGSMSSYQTTDEEGRIRIRLSPPFSSGGLSALNLHVEAAPDDEEAGGARGSGSIHLEGSELPELGAGDTDLGVLTLTTPPLLVGGRVVDTNGDPVANVSVQCGWLYHPSSNDQVPPQLLSAGDAGARTDADGRFRVEADDMDPPWAGLHLDERALQVSGDSLVPVELVPFRPGEEDVLVTVVRGGWIEGTAQVSDLRLLGGVAIEARRSGSSKPVDASAGWSDSSFRLDGLQEGAWDVTFTARGDSRPVALVEGVRVPGGGAAEDARLHPVDLHALRRYRLTVRGEDGDLPGRVQVTRRDVGATDWSPVSDRFGSSGPRVVFDLVTAFPGFDLRVEAPGYIPAELLRVDGDRDVLLSHGIPVVVAIVGDPLSRIDGDARLQLLLQQESSSKITEWIEVPKDAHEVTLHATVPGTYRLQTSMLVRTDSWTWSFPVGSGSIGPFEVSDGVHSARVRLDLDPEEVRARYEERTAAQENGGR